MSAEQRHLAHRENFKITFDLAGAYARWLLSTLLLLNSGAIAGLFQKDAARSHLVALCFFALGVFFALLSGIMGWFNLQLAAKHYHFEAVGALEGKADAPQPVSLKRTRTLGLVAAFASVGCLGLGAFFVLFALTH